MVLARVCADGLDVRDRASSCEDGHSPEHALLRLCQERVAPADRRVERLLSLGNVASARCEHVERVVEPLEQRIRRQQPEAGSGELECERQAVQALADGRDGRRVLRRQLERFPGRLGALDEQRDGGRTAERMGIVDVQVVRQGQGRHPVFVLAADAQRRLARDEEAELRCGGEQLGHEGRRGQDLLEVVEHEQRGAAAE